MSKSRARPSFSVRPFVYRNRTLYCDDVSLTTLATEYGTPLYVYSAQQIDQRYLLFEQAFANRPHTICYAVKANSSLAILHLLATAGAGFVFGKLASPPDMEGAFGKGNGFVFAFVALPTIVFVSSFFSVLYYFGVLQFLVRLMARVMMFVMGTSGAETLSVAANVFMGQTEAPLIVRPFVPRISRTRPI